MNKFNIGDFAESKSKNRKITMIASYDFHSAKLLSAAEIDIILVGDSLGMVVQGNQNTLSVTIDEMIYHTKAVRRGAPNTFIVADMPYLTYHMDINSTIQNAGLLISKAGADAVKLEINHENAINHISALHAAQIPVIAHVGMTPQSINMFGGFKLQGKTQTQVEHIQHLAIQAETNGAIACVVECIPSSLAKLLTENLKIATIGIGAGKDCDGQVLVLNDLLGLTIKPPKFAKSYLNGSELFNEAIISFIKEVQNSEFPSINHSF